MKNYQPSELESTWYTYWMKHDFFSSKPDQRIPYTIVIPPPNVTGVLHMGHMLNNTIQDVLIRRARLLGKNACWVPGTDHASIATEAKVVQRLKERGQSKETLGREAFLDEAWKWTEEYGGIILEQLKRLGASCDWSRTAFTLDDTRYASVIRSFKDLYEKGLIYRGYRMVNWDPEARTTISDEEVIHKERSSKLYFVRYPLEDSDAFLTIATTRPETIMGDTGVCINPNDERYFHLHGKKVIIPIVNRSVPIVLDEYVDPAFGTGCLKVTPANDINDYNIGVKHNLAIIDVLNEDGTLNENGAQFAGMDRFVARKAVAEFLRDEGLLIKEEDYQSSVGTSERTGAVIEPRLSRQWFLKMDELAKPAIKAVENGTVNLVPDKFKATYFHWMENIRDWCISRQLWWGHRIPAFYYGQGESDFVVAESIDEALIAARKQTDNANLTTADLRQDEDVLDTWFSSWLWPLSVFDGIVHPNNEDINYYYPTQDLVSGPDILFFWIARMVMAGYEYRSEQPFSHVYLTGIVRDEKGRKMSKQLGNSPDALKLIEQHGADGVRVGILLSAPAGNDLLFNEELCVQGRNFGNKIWNAFRLLSQWSSSDNRPMEASDQLAMDWFARRLSDVRLEVDQAFDRYRLSDALMQLYKLVWDDFCSWYLEMVKPGEGKELHPVVLERTRDFFEELMVLLHPYMPFITEELWQGLRARDEGETIMLAAWPTTQSDSSDVVLRFEEARELIAQVRQIRLEKQMGFKETVTLSVMQKEAFDHPFVPVMKKMARIDAIDSIQEVPAGSVSFIAFGKAFYMPLGEHMDADAERAKALEEITYLEGFLKSVEKKLSNERFVQGAPEQVVALEKKKKADAMAKMEQLRERIASL